MLSWRLVPASKSKASWRVTGSTSAPLWRKLRCAPWPTAEASVNGLPMPAALRMASTDSRMLLAEMRVARSARRVRNWAKSSKEYCSLAGISPACSTRSTGALAGAGFEGRLDGCIGSRIGLDRNRSHASVASMQAARATRKGVHPHFIKYSWISCTKRGSTCNELWISMAMLREQAAASTK